MKRLCEIREELRLPVLEVGDAKTIRSWDSLKCPRSGGHCDSSKPCLGMNSENLLKISRIEDRLFGAGFVHINSEQPVESGVSWKHLPRKGDL